MSWSHYPTWKLFHNPLVSSNNQSILKFSWFLLFAFDNPNRFHKWYLVVSSLHSLLIYSSAPSYLFKKCYYSENWVSSIRCTTFWICRFLWYHLFFPVSSYFCKCKLASESPDYLDSNSSVFARIFNGWCLIDHIASY